MTNPTETTPTKPVGTLRDGALKATIWKRQSEKGPFYTVDLSRTYTDRDGNFKDSKSFSNAELLRIARLAEIAYSEVLIFKGYDPEAEYEAEHGGDQ
jgi:hypothetical protein